MEDKHKELFAKNFKKAMLEAGLSNNDVSEAMNGVAPQSVTAYRSGKMIPPIRYIIMFAEKYGVSLDWLLRDIGDMYLPAQEELEDRDNEWENMKAKLDHLEKIVMAFVEKQNS